MLAGTISVSKVEERFQAPTHLDGPDVGIRDVVELISLQAESGHRACEARAQVPDRRSQADHANEGGDKCDLTTLRRKTEVQVGECISKQTMLT